ncbi:MAG: hypothetical protein HFI08_02025 [Bacilli bacterium]|jgi:hypothetical protein|nr:hypothetical protein [Bacilli bacterium]
MNGKLWNKLKGITSLYQNDEEEIKELLLGRTIEKVNDNTLKLDNGLILEIQPNQGCCCGAGDYDITELNECLNVITNVELVEENINNSDGWSDEYSYKIFVYAEDKKIKLLQVDGDDGNGYYGTGYEIVIKKIEEVEK